MPLVNFLYIKANIIIVKGLPDINIYALLHIKPIGINSVEITVSNLRISLNSVAIYIPSFLFPSIVIIEKFKNPQQN